ncbi:DUF6895 family protein [Tessaracoccus flavus]|uniref:DUF6895 domain-containing protein n=1 Tax=Tessaracoccus flavus TaxID=1610493 RepID=A0A1Q2CDC7_9ACTN|nr:hypothetical protein [Tessaracoccus flavus]AQP44097.1 hypothetical protein RPIT_04110 [Tessaracoccus flavus]SDY34823.1 hypothetical protein SAMN05428934_101425 [Tessaracoccus flavus]
MSVNSIRGRQREEQRLAAVLGHAEATLDALELDTGKHSHEDFFTRTKLAAETSLLLLATHRAQLGPGMDERVRRIGSRLTAAARSIELLTWVQLRPHILPELSVPHLVLSAVGLPDEDFAAALAHAAQTTSVAPTERLPWKQIERCWQHDLGAPACLPPLAARLEATALAARQDALFATREEVYSFTHALIYHTDFGHRQPGLPRPAGDLVEDAGSALARCLDDDDFDLAAEVLFTWPYLRQSWDATSVFGLRLLRDVDDEVGFLPSMTLSQERFRELDGDAARRYFYAESYHTVFVLGLLTAATLSPGIETCPGSVAAPELAHVAEQVLDLMPAAEHHRQWEQVARDLPSVERGALVPMLGDIAVRRAVRQSDFRRVREIVETVLDSGATAGTATIQGAELVLRLGSSPATRAAATTPRG